MGTGYWKDLDMELNINTYGDISDLIDYDAINGSLTNMFNTIQGSRRMLPDYALPLYRLLFEPISTTVGSNIGELIISSITRWEPRIVVDNTNIVVDEDNNVYEVTITYHIVSESSGNNQTFNIILQAR